MNLVEMGKKPECVFENYGRVTLPVEAGMEKEGVELARILGADAVRDCDGVVMPEQIAGKREFKIVSTLCLVRADQGWAKKHPGARPQRYLMTPRATAESAELTVRLMENFYAEQYELDTLNDAKKYWEVIDRTTNKVVPPERWSFNPEAGVVTISPAKIGHEYTVSFLVYVIWDSTSMYNYKINRWTGEHVIPVDPRHPETRRHLLEYLDNWLSNHPRTDVVRLTSLTYHFPVIMAADGEKIQFRDWYGYQECASVHALDQFEKEYGYRLRPEDLVDEGYYRRIDRLPSPGYRDWMEFQHRFVTAWGKEVVDVIHRQGKKALLFWCDHWIGTEPYGEHFRDMNLDGVVTPSHTGFHVRRLAGFKGRQFRALRFQPYFFPDRFGEGFDNVSKFRGYWIDQRRALLRAPVDRVGFGGYLSLAVGEGGFVDLMKKVCDEFRSIQAITGGEKSYRSPITAGILNVWGKLRTWQSTGTYIYHVPFVSEFYQAISGLPVEFKFLNFEEVTKGVPRGIDLLLNIGQAGSAFSGGRVWNEKRLAESLRKWVSQGGGFIGIGAPSEWERDGKLWQMRDVLGVERGAGPAISSRENKDHWILRDLSSPEIEPEEKVVGVYPVSTTTEVLLTQEEGGVLVSAATFGRGRSVYFSGCRYRPDFTRLLLRALFWVARKEEGLKKWFAADINVEAAYYPRAGAVAVVNNSGNLRDTELYGEQGKKVRISLEPYELKWLSAEGLK